MKPLAVAPPSVSAAEAPRPRVRRSRHHPRTAAVVWGAFLLLLAFAGFVGFLWLGGQLLLTGDRTHGFFALGSLAVFLLARVGAFLNNRYLMCTLCHGPLLHEKSCRKHAEATRIPGLSYRASTVVRVLCTGGYRCMYCGSSYRLRH